ncbi:MAG: acylphosphatase [Thermoplasmatales archaeon]|nr:acylphosphatase [Thermoplasmatales archaeon]
MIRATITITGDVQEAGYRVVVRDTARKLGLVGFAENMPDGTVKVVCEGEKKVVEGFVQTIKIKIETITVENIKIDYSDANGEFDGKGFIVKVTDLGDELFQGFATSLKYFKIGWGKQDETTAAIKGLDKKQDKMIGKQDKMIEKQDEMIGKQDKTIEVIGTRFDTMDTKYGDISETMKEMKKLFEKLVDHIIKKER